MKNDKRLKELGLIREIVGKEGIIEDRLAPMGREMAIDALREADFQLYAIKLMRQMQYTEEDIDDFFFEINIRRVV